VWSLPVGGNGHALEPLTGGGVDRFRANDAFRPETLDNLWVVNDVADRRDRSGLLGGLLNDVQCPPNSPAVAKFVGHDDAFLVG